MLRPQARGGARRAVRFDGSAVRQHGGDQSYDVGQRPKRHQRRIQAVSFAECVLPIDEIPNEPKELPEVRDASQEGL